MVIDFHVHCFNPKIAEKAIARLSAVSGLTPYTAGLTEQTVKLFDEWGIDRGVILPIATKPSQQKVINDWAAEQDDGRFISFGSIHPDAEDLCEELDRIKSLGLHGIKLHADYQDFWVDDPKMDAVYYEIEKRGLPLVLHSGHDWISPETPHCTPERAAKMLSRHKGLKVILAHMGANGQWQSVYDLIAGMDGEIYFDTAYGSVCPDETMEKLINKHGADRILFGSDCPWDNSMKIKEKILKLHISDGDKEKILGKNAERLLNL